MDIEMEDDFCMATIKQSEIEPQTTSSSSEGFHIDFLDFGKVGKITQVFGRKGGIIPDGLCGTNEVYNENSGNFKSSTKSKVKRCSSNGTLPT